MNTKNSFEIGDRSQHFKDFTIPAQLKISVTVLTTFAWLSFSLYWIAFLWRRYTAFQNIVLLIVFFLIFSAINAIHWTLE